MTDSELLDRLIDAFELLERALVYAEERSLKKFKKTMIAQFVHKARRYYRACLRDARQASFKRRGILPYGANGRTLFPEGTREYSELDHLEEAFLKLENTPNLEPDKDWQKKYKKLC